MPGEQLVAISQLESFLQEHNISVRARWAEPMKGLEDAYYMLTAMLGVDEIVVCCIDPSGQIEPSIEEIYEKLQ